MNESHLNEQSSVLEGGRQSCAVPYRLKNGRPEFCLVSLNNDSRWDFPRGLTPTGEPGHVTAQRFAADLAGLECEAVGNEPLDEFGDGYMYTFQAPRREQCHEFRAAGRGTKFVAQDEATVSYTHLTLPTKA